MDKFHKPTGFSLGEAIDYSRVRDICTLDARAVSTNITRFVNANLDQYYCAINAWLYLMIDVTGDDRLAIRMLDIIMSIGLLATIKYCNEIADNFIQGLCDPEGFSPSDPYCTHDIAVIFTMDIPDDDRLQLLRFLKRFTPTAADLLQQASLDQFRKVNDRNACYSPCLYLEERIRDKILEILPLETVYSGPDPVAFANNYMCSNMQFSSGTCLDGRTLVQKLSGFSKFEKCWKGSPLYPLGDCTNVEDREVYADPYYDWEVFYCISPSAVPKSYRAYRIIAPERSYEAARMQGLRKLIREVQSHSPWSSLFNPEVQDTNRQACFEASLNGMRATLDLTAASDSISYELAKRVLPKWVFKNVDRYRATYLKIRDVSGSGYYITTNNIFLTSGNACTFDLEGDIFLAIVLVAGDLYHLFTGEEVLSPYIFGDDIICDTKVVATVVDILTRLGLVVNDSKSFFTPESRFRESCGVEYINGYSLTSDYWPRRYVNVMTPEGIGSLCALQHRVYRYPRVELFLRRFIKQVVPDMTSSLPGTDCFDMWESIPKFGKRSAPIKKGAPVPPIPDECRLREAHYVLSQESKHYPDIGTQAFYNLESYRYARFLEFGPQYEDPLSELLNVTTQRVVDESEEKPPLILRKVVI